MQLPLQNKISTLSTKTSTYRGDVVDFDNGYSQRVTRGPASARKLDTWVLVFSQLNKAQMQTMVAFLDSVGNYELFEATMPTDTLEKSWRVQTTCTHTTLHDENHTITFTIRQELV